MSRLRYHLRSGDYFAFLATVFGVLEDNIAHGPLNPSDQLALIKNMRKDLIYLQQEYQIAEAAIEA